MSTLGPIQTQRLVRRYIAEERWMEAMVVCKQAIKVIPDFLEFRMLLSEVYRLQGKTVRAVEQLQQLLALDPEFPGARPALERLTLPEDVRLARLLDR